MEILVNVGIFDEKCLGNGLYSLNNCPNPFGKILVGNGFALWGFPQETNLGSLSSADKLKLIWSKPGILGEKYQKYELKYMSDI